MCATEIVRDLKIEVKGDCYTVRGQFEWPLSVSAPEAPDQVHRAVDRMGQLLKCQTYGAVLEEVDRQIVAQRNKR